MAKRKNKWKQPSEAAVIRTAGGLEIDRKAAQSRQNTAWGTDLRDPGLPPSEVAAAGTLNPEIVAMQLRSQDPPDVSAGPITLNLFPSLS